MSHDTCLLDANIIYKMGVLGDTSKGSLLAMLYHDLNECLKDKVNAVTVSSQVSEDNG